MCEHPNRIYYKDIIRGGRSAVDVSCGKCNECLKQQQDSWSFRIRKEFESRGACIWDTFTYNDASVPLIDVSDLANNLQELDKFSDETISYLLHNNFYIKTFDRRDLVNHIKRGRENFYKKNGYRLNMKYFICSEYGEKIDCFRPHYHLIVFGVSLEQWQEYFALPWRERFGFTYTEYLTTFDNKHAASISSYIAKYQNKGAFECPLVTDGLVDKPFRLCSCGLGIDYYTNTLLPAFNTYFSPFEKFLRDEKTYTNMFRRGTFDKDLLSLFNAFKHFSIEDLLCCIDSGGFCHHVPRYYLNKLFGYKPSTFKTALQDYQRARFERCGNEQLVLFARSRGFKNFEVEQRLSNNGSPSLAFIQLLDSFYNEQDNVKLSRSKRFASKITTFYNNPNTF